MGKAHIDRRQREKNGEVQTMGKCIPKMKISTVRKVVSKNPKKAHYSRSSLDSEMWIQVAESFGYVPKYFPDPTPTTSDKENELPNNTQTVMTLNILNLSGKARNQEGVAFPE